MAASIQRAPFPYFGGKSSVAAEVWRRFGDVPNYVEPFFGSGAVLLGRPHPPRTETVNDLDGYIANFWRAVAEDPEAVAHYADWPVNENDLHARHTWLVNRRDDLQARLEGDPSFYDPQVAGWWVWGICCWIGSGFCSGTGPWAAVDGQLVYLGNRGRGVHRQRVHLGDGGRGVLRRRVHLGGRGVHRKLSLYEWFAALAERLRRVRVCSGDWTRVVTPCVTWQHGTTGVFFDPPYGQDREPDLYAQDSPGISVAVHAWALANGDDPRLRIALCGYEGEHEMPEGWTMYAWHRPGGLANSSTSSARKAKRHRERIWFSSHCLPVEESQPSLWSPT